MTGARGFYRSLTLAGRGVRFAWQSQAHLRFEALAATLAVGAAGWLERGLLSVTLVSALVLTAELLNSALEAVVDLVSPDHHPLAERAKDIAAGAVLVASAFAVLVGLLVFGPPLWAFSVGGWR